MDSKIGTQSQGLRVEISGARNRQTPDTSFGNVMGTGLTRTANAVMAGGQLAAPFIPGGAVLSAAINGLGTVKSAAAGGGGAATVSSGMTASGGVNSFQVNGGAGTSVGGTVAGQGSVGVAGGGVDALAASGDSSAILMQETRQMQELNQSFNLQYLSLQQNMQSENRQFTTLSNIMKTKHDTAKNAINNVR
ncbi:MAG: hypothetical protein AAFQ82_06415 [Myxococcota bacterium]